MPDFVTSDGLRLHYEDNGAGQPLLCLAGLTRNSRDFDYMRPHLSDVRMIALDYRGRGRSDWADPATYTIATEARDTVELLDHLELERAPILGTSRGGLIAMVLAGHAKARLSGVCLNDIGPEIAPEGLEAIMGYIGRSPGQVTRAEAATARAALMAGFEGVPMSRWEDEVDKHYREDAEGLVIDYDPALAESVKAAGAEPAADLWPLFDSLAGLPLACLRGENSNILSPDTLAAMTARRPDMLVGEIEGRGHVPFLDEPQALAVVQAWLGQL